MEKLKQSKQILEDIAMEPDWLDFIYDYYLNFFQALKKHIQFSTMYNYNCTYHISVYSHTIFVRSMGMLSMCLLKK